MLQGCETARFIACIVAPRPLDGRGILAGLAMHSPACGDVRPRVPMPVQDYENFPVAWLLLPAGLREPVQAV